MFETIYVLLIKILFMRYTDNIRIIKYEVGKLIKDHSLM